MNILFFLTPKSELSYIYDDDSLRQALEKMEYHRYTAIPVINRKGVCGNHHRGRSAVLPEKSIFPEFPGRGKGADLRGQPTDEQPADPHRCRHRGSPPAVHQPEFRSCHR